MLFVLSDIISFDFRFFFLAENFWHFRFPENRPYLRCRLIDLELKWQNLLLNIVYRAVLAIWLLNITQKSLKYDIFYTCELNLLCIIIMRLARMSPGPFTTPPVSRVLFTSDLLVRDPCAIDKKSVEDFFQSSSIKFRSKNQTSKNCLK